MSNDQLILKTTVYFSYNQFMVFDASVQPGCDWTADHTRQGFARRESNVSFASLLEFGEAELTVRRGPFPGGEYDRVIEVHLRVLTGELVFEGPEEIQTGRAIRLEPGVYRITAAQALLDDEHQLFDFFIEPAHLMLPSRVLVADEELDPPAELLETVGVPDV